MILTDWYRPSEEGGSFIKNVTRIFVTHSAQGILLQIFWLSICSQAGGIIIGKIVQTGMIGGKDSTMVLLLFIQNLLCVT